MTSKMANKFSVEVRARAVRMVQQHGGVRALSIDRRIHTAAPCAIAPLIVSPATNNHCAANDTPGPRPCEDNSLPAKENAMTPMPAPAPALLPPWVNQQRSRSVRAAP
jgi:hypothetical protein